MACSRALKPMTFILSTDTTEVQYVFTDAWVLVSAASVLDATPLQRAVTGNFTSKPAIQMAAVRPENPGGPGAMAAGSYTGSTGYTLFHEAGFVTSGMMWARAGSAYKLSAAGGLGTAQVTLQPYLFGCVEQLGGGELSIQPGTVSGTDENFVTLTGWSPAAGLQKVLAAVLVTDNLSTYLEYQLVVRSCVDTRSPNAWQTAEAAFTNPSVANSERNTGELSIPSGCNLTSNALVQVGIVWRRKAGSAGNPRATIQAIVAATRG